MTGHNIHLFSHGFQLGKLSSLPSLCWIPDFQHKRLPDMFSVSEIAQRDDNFAKITFNSQGVIFSSEDARKDYLKFFPKHWAKAYVLRFVAQPPIISLGVSKQVLLKWQIDEPYFHVPNQLWRHKNHRVVLESLRLLKAQGRCPLVISTGFTKDYRHPEYFDELCSEVKSANLEERFRFLGLIDFSDVGGLMQNAIAMINPSRFEGWSTTVEEAKSLGKRILLSDIPVHREQNPERASYFDPDAPETLALQMRQVIEEYSPAAEGSATQKANQKLPERTRQFGINYEKIVLDILHK